jgi:hypothetical protein
VATRLAVCSLMPPSTTFPVASVGVWPLRKISPGTLVALNVKVDETRDADENKVGG